jgi:hypothetical protein
VKPLTRYAPALEGGGPYAADYATMLEDERGSYYAKDEADARFAELEAKQAGVVEALRPLEVELEKLDDATERDSTPEMVGATWRLIEAARAALAAVKEKDRG